MKRYINIILLCCLFVLSSYSWSDAISLDNGDSVTSILSSHMGKRVSIVLNSGQELTGTVTTVTTELTHLSELAGKGFYDAAVVNEDIAAIIVRAK